MIANMQIKGVIFDLMDTLAYIDSEIYLSTHHQFAEIMGVSWERFNDTWKMSRPKALTGFIFILSCKVGHKKPDQIIYKKALEALELSPLECVFVGDGNDFELDGAKSIGMHTIRITRPLGPYASSSNQSTAFDFQVASLSELHQLLLDQ
ncbi:MAG: HAD-IA family hydrolase [Desulfobacteraceae bacterium]